MQVTPASRSGHGRRLISLSLSLALWTPVAVAQPELDIDSRDELLALLDEQTELATKTRLNVDYVPGIVDILHGDELASRGAQSVWDALSFVPGINPVMDQLGHRRLIVRGLGTIGDNWSSGYFKFLLNGAAVDTGDKGLADPVAYIPIAQVERIEVIRGPGSGVHGENAVAGVVNIITRRDDNRAFIFGGSFDTFGAGGVARGDLGDLNVSLNVGAWRSGGADVQTGTDALHQSGLGTASYAPGRANEGIVARNGIAQVDYKGVSLLAQWTDSDLGDYFGINYNLPPSHDKLVEYSSIGLLEARYRHEMASGRAELYAGRRLYRLRKDGLFADPSESYGIANGQDVTVNLDYEEAKRYWGADTIWNLGLHQLLVGFEQTLIEVDRADQSSNLSFATGAPQITPEQHPGSYAVVAGTARRYYSVTLQDEIRASERFSVTTGVRYDNYSEIGSSITPRVAGVWRFGEQQVLKAQYGRAFRPPTLSEQAFGHPGIHPVVADTFELGYLYKAVRGEWRATGAYSELRDIIVFNPSNPPYFYVNEQSARLRSIELQAKRELGERWRIDGSIAYADTQLGRTGGRIPGASDWLGRLGIMFTATPDITTNLEYRYVSGYARQWGDPRASANGCGLFDFTITARLLEGMTLRGTVENLADADLRYPAFLAKDSSNNTIVSYPADLPRPGRSIWIHLTSEF